METGVKAELSVPASSPHCCDRRTASPFDGLTVQHVCDSGSIEELLAGQLDRDWVVAAGSNHSDDQGLGQSGESSFSSSGEEGTDDDDSKDEDDTGLILQRILCGIMALDLRKKTNRERYEESDDGNVSDDDNTSCATMTPLDLTARSRVHEEKATNHSGTPGCLVSRPSSKATNCSNSNNSNNSSSSGSGSSNSSGRTSAVKSLSDAEVDQLRSAHRKLVYLFRLNTPPESYGMTDASRLSAIRHLQSFLLTYLCEVKRKSPTGLELFRQTFADERSITRFFHLLINESKRQQHQQAVTRTPSAPASVLRPTRFGVDQDKLVVLSRGPEPRVRTVNNTAPYPSPSSRRTCDLLGSNVNYPYAPWRTGQQQQQPSSMTTMAPSAFHPHHPNTSTPYGQQQKHQPQMTPWQQQQHSQHVHPRLQEVHSVPITPLPNYYENEAIDISELIEVITGVEGLASPEEFLELYGPDRLDWPPPPPSSDAADYLVFSPTGSSQPATPNSMAAVGPSSSTGSPASPWITTTHLREDLPYSPPSSQASQQRCSPNVINRFDSPSSIMSPPPSSVGSSASGASRSPLMGMPVSPVPYSVVNGMDCMQLVPAVDMTKNAAATPFKSQPPPLIPLNIPPPAGAVGVGTTTVTWPDPIPPLPFPTAREELMSLLDPELKEQSMRRIVKTPIEELISPDADGDTFLMVASANPNIKYEDLYALVERLKSHPEPAKVFAAFNKKRETALYLAASELRPLVAGYLAETMSGLRIPLNQTYQNKSNTLIHEISSWGYVQVLQYLVRVRTADGTRPAFDLNASNREGRSALHDAVAHYQEGDPFSSDHIKVIQLLLDHGADAGLSDKTSGKTPVHIAIEKRDPKLLELLLAKCPHAANAPMYNDNRPLHSAATLGLVNETQQLELVNILLRYGADKTLRNKANKLPIELVHHGREKVKNVLQARARQITYGSM